MNKHEKIVPQRSDISAGKCAPTLADGKLLTAGEGVWTLGEAVKIMDADTASNTFIVTDILIEMELSYPEEEL